MTLTRSSSGSSSSRLARPVAPALPTMLSSLWNRTSSPSWKASTNSLMSLGGEVNSIGGPRLPCYAGVVDIAAGPLGPTAGVVGSTAGAVGTTPGVVDSTAEALCTAAEVLGTPSVVLGTPPGVLGTALGVLGSVAGVVDTSSPTSPPPWMAKCSMMKVLVKPPASPVPRLSQSQAAFSSNTTSRETTTLPPHGS